MTWSRATAVVGSAVVTLILPKFGSFVGIVKRSETAGWRLAPAGMTKEAALLQFNSVPYAGEHTAITRTRAI